MYKTLDITKKPEGVYREAQIEGTTVYITLANTIFGTLNIEYMHLNGDIFDNRRENLRPMLSCAFTEN